MSERRAPEASVAARKRAAADAADKAIAPALATRRLLEPQRELVAELLAAASRGQGVPVAGVPEVSQKVFVQRWYTRTCSNGGWTGGDGPGTVDGMTWTRRDFVVRAAKTAAIAPLGGLLACTDDGSDASRTEAGTEAGTGEGSSSGGGSASGTSGSTGSSTVTSGSGGSTATNSPTTGRGSTETGDESASESEGSTGTAACELSPDDIEGPFYRPGIPVGGDLDVHGDSGVALRIEGTVLSEGCVPLANAVVEIWHATPVAPGAEPGDDDAIYDSTNAYRYYGQVATDARGRYAFNTLRPGWYLNGPQYRPAHLHVKVWVRGVERLTSQLYFEGDPFNAGDSWFNPVMALDPDEAGLANIDFVV